MGWLQLIFVLLRASLRPPPILDSEGVGLT